MVGRGLPRKGAQAGSQIEKLSRGGVYSDNSVYNKPVSPSSRSTRTAPELYVIAGPNGAGKTTFATEFLPHFAKCREFVNADLIARGLSPFSPGAVAVEASRLMLGKINDLAGQRRTFAFETTLSGRSYLALFQRLKALGYRIHVIFLWLPEVDIAIRRVRDRARRGGHSVPEIDIRRRFKRGIRNLLGEYQRIVDTWTLLDNSGDQPRLVASFDGAESVAFDNALFEKIKGASQ